MLHQHNHSTLLGSKRQSIYYPPDGSGRDAYIRTNNGGTNITYRMQGVPETGNYMKFGPSRRGYRPGSYTRYQKYLSDGSGRDKYVISGHGGQYNEEDQNSLLLIKFKQTMRDGGWKRGGKTTITDFYKTTSQIKQAYDLNKTQQVNSRRLSTPKRKSDNYLYKLEQMKKMFHK